MPVFKYATSGFYDLRSTTRPQWPVREKQTFNEHITRTSMYVLQRESAQFCTSKLGYCSSFQSFKLIFKFSFVRM